MIKSNVPKIDHAKIAEYYDKVRKILFKNSKPLLSIAKKTFKKLKNQWRN